MNKISIKTKAYFQVIKQQRKEIVIVKRKFNRKEMETIHPKA